MGNNTKPMFTAEEICEKAYLCKIYCKKDEKSIVLSELFKKYGFEATKIEKTEKTENGNEKKIITYSTKCPEGWKSAYLYYIGNDYIVWCKEDDPIFQIRYSYDDYHNNCGEFTGNIFGDVDKSDILEAIKNNKSEALRASEHINEAYKPLENALSESITELVQKPNEIRSRMDLNYFFTGLVTSNDNKRKNEEILENSKKNKII
jgi:hypothetical protein